ncbi:MAG: hypothetical protein NTW97_00965 [Candidatus Krumholzibacteria bacterium]|nr:hypothetical protein [Candidatus Krumholzibacteria bacterium]
MKNLLLSLVLVMCLAAGANAQQGMLALFSDTENNECHSDVGIGAIGNLYLMYVRGDGPRMGNAYEFKLLKSSSASAILSPTWPSSIIITLGAIETGISLCAAECFPDENYVSLGTIPVMNVSDPDTFTVEIVPDPEQVPQHAIVILECKEERPIYIVLPGGAFVFNGGCYSPLDPFGPVATKETTWGGIKELYR